MKRTIFILIFLFSLIYSGYTQKCTEIIEYKTIQGDTINFNINKKKIFNDDGLVVSEIEYTNNTVAKYYYKDTLLQKKEVWKADSIIETESYTYDLNHNIILIETHIKTFVLSKDIFIFDKYNFLIEETHFFEDSTGDKTFYSNNENGKDTLEIEWQLDENGIWEKTCHSTTKWNSNGKIIEWKNSVCNPNRNALETWEWNEKDQLIRKRTFTRDGKLYRDYVYNYVEGGYEIISTGYDYDGSKKHLNTKSWDYQPQYFTYCKTDEQGRLIEEKVFDEKENFFSLKIFRYDEAGNLVQKIYCNSDGTLNFSCKYEYK